MPNTHDMLNQIVSLYNQRNLKDAEIICRKVLEHEPDNANAHHFLGIIAWEVGELEFAKTCIEKSIALDPDNPSCYLNMGNVFQKENKYADSLKWYEKALDFEYSEKQKVYNSIGVAQTKLGRLEKAVTSLGKAIEQDPNYVEAHANISVAYKDMGQYEKALVSCERAIQLSPGFVPARWNRSILWFLKSDFSRAWPEYEWRWKRPQTPPKGYCFRSKVGRAGLSWENVVCV